MQCAFCGGRTKSERVTFQHEENGRFILIENVPAEVCPSCGERTYSPEVADKLLRIAREEIPFTRTIQVPLFDFAKTG